MNTLSQIIDYSKEAMLLNELYPNHDFITIIHNGIGTSGSEEKLLVDKNVIVKDLLIKYSTYYKIKVIYKSRELYVSKNEYIHNLFQRYNKRGVLYIVMHKQETFEQNIRKHVYSLFKNLKSIFISV